MRAPKPKVGDVFVVPVDDERVGVGQVVAAYSRSYYFAIFSEVIPVDDATSKAVGVVGEAPILLLALAMDAKIHAGHWTIVDHAPVDPDVPLPAYKVSMGTVENFYVEDFSGKRSRPATMEEAAMLPFRTVSAPVALETALKSTLGLAPWHDAYDEFRPANIVTSRSVFG